MKTDKFHFYSLLAVFTLFPFCVGGYYTFYCALGGIVLAALLLVSVFRTKKLNVSLGVSAAVLALVAVSYLVVKFWALDKTMSLYGFVKFVVPLLFALNLWQVDGDDRPKLLYTLPFSAALMTVISFALGHIDSLHSRFYDNMGDLHGFFEYANGFAIYLLVAAVIAVLKPKKGAGAIALDTACAVICAFGIYLTDARAVYVLSAGIIVLGALAFSYGKCKTKKAKTVFVSSAAAVLAVCAVVLAASGLGAKVAHAVLTDRSVVERGLFWKDAFMYALHHPFGKGEYAFYYVQKEIQSAAYYAIDVHNDFIQMAVEIGFVPAVLFVAMLVKSFFSKSTTLLHKLVLAAISTHAFFDYDLQFISIFLVLVLCLDFGREKEIEIKSKLIPSLICIALVVLNIVTGLASFYNYVGDQKKSVYYYKNTSALVVLMLRTNSQQEGYELASELLDINDNIFEANNVLSRIYAANQRYDEAIKQMELVLKKSPCDMEYYEEYIDLCKTAADYYAAEKDEDMKSVCLEKIAAVPETLDRLEKNTPEKAKKYGRKQSFEIDGEHMKLVREAKGVLQ